jgi:ankyrin repeat protein
MSLTTLECGNDNETLRRHRDNVQRVFQPGLIQDIILSNLKNIHSLGEVQACLSLHALKYLSAENLKIHFAESFRKHYRRQPKYLDMQCLDEEKKSYILKMLGQAADVKRCRLLAVVPKLLFEHVRAGVMAMTQLRLYGRKRDLSGNQRKKEVRRIVDHHLHALCCVGVEPFKVESLAEFMTRSTKVLDLVRVCAKFGHIDLLKFFLAKGRRFDVEFDVDMCKRVAVEMAAEYGHLGILRSLLDGSKGMVNKGVAFKIACRNGWKDICCYLIDCMIGRAHQTLAIINDGFSNAPGHACMDILEILIDRGLDRVIKDDTWMNVLGEVTATNDIDAVKLLLQKGQFVTPNRNCDVAVFVASKYNYPDILKVLVNTGKVNLNLRSPIRGQTALHVACALGHAEVVELLLETGRVEVELVDDYGRTPLMHACQCGHVGIAKLLIETGSVNLNATDEFGNTPLMHACQCGHVGIAKLLIETGSVNLNATDEFGNTPLIYACGCGHIEIAKLLIETGNVDLNAAGDFGRTPFTCACQLGHFEMVKLLINTDNVNLNASDDELKTPLMYACEGGHAEIVKLLINTDDVDLDSIEDHGMSPLLYACEAGHVEIVKLLVKDGRVDLNRFESTRTTPLMLACHLQNVDIVSILLNNGGLKLDARDHKGTTALMHACLIGHVDAVKLLFDSGRLPQSEINAAWAAAAEDGNDDMLRAIILSGKLQVNSLDGDSLLNHACEFGAVDIVKQLIEIGDVDFNSSICHKTPLMQAAENGHLDIVKLLLEIKEVRVNDQDEYGRTALSYACRMKHVAIAECILESSPNVDRLLRDRYNKDPLAYASENACLGAIKLLLTTGFFADISKEKDSVNNAISCATAKFKQETVLPTLLAYRRALSKVHAGMSRSAFSCRL